MTDLMQKAVEAADEAYGLAFPTRDMSPKQFDVAVKEAMRVAIEAALRVLSAEAVGFVEHGAVRMLNNPDWGGAHICRTRNDKYSVPVFLARPPTVRNPWQAAVDEGRVVAHLGIAADGVTREEAERQLGELIDWHVKVATDPAVNGGFSLQPAAQPAIPEGWVLVPSEPTAEMLEAFRVAQKKTPETVVPQYVAEGYECWAAMLSAAPSPAGGGDDRSQWN